MYKWIPINSKADLAVLSKVISSEYDPQRVVKKLSDGISGAVKAILIEYNYIDKDYRSTYYNFYAKKGKSYNPNCVRLHFFDETVAFDPKAFKLTSQEKDPTGELKHHYFGYMVLRPTTIATIGRSVVSPKVRTGASGSLITARHKVHLLGYRLEVVGFPSMDQHSDISVCAHVACWGILRHYSECFTSSREFLTYDITLMAQQFDPGGLVPSKGLEVSHAERVFQEAGTFPFLVARAGKKDPAFYRQLHAYVESGFPLFAALPSREHAIAVIGYGLKDPDTKPFKKMRYSWDEVKSIVVVDDNFLPYLSVPHTKSLGPGYCTKDIDSFIVALPDKIFYPADAVDKLSPILFKLAKALNLPSQNKTLIRYFIATNSTFRKFIRERGSEFDPKLIQTIMALPFAKFIWIVELATAEDWAKGQISARAVLDATASLKDNCPFWLFHSRTAAFVFDRNLKGADGDPKAIRALKLSGMESTAFSRFDLLGRIETKIK
jgi:hypothetical protein